MSVFQVMGSNAAELLPAAMREHQAGRLDHAKALYMRVLNLEPDHPFALHLLALVAYQRGQYAEGIELVTRAIGLRGDAPQFHTNLANLLKGQGKLPEAIAAYRKALQFDPSFADAHNNLGNAYLSTEAYADAERCFREAIRAGGEQPDFLCNLAVALQHQAQMENALALLRRAVSLQPDHARAWYNLGNAHAELGQRNEAQECYRRAVDLDPALVEAWYNLGNEWCRAGDVEQAGGCYQRVLSLQPDHVQAIHNLGNVLQSAGCSAEACACYAQVLQLQPNHAGAYYCLGNALQSQGKPAEAAEKYDLALALDPEMVKAYHMKSGALYGQGRIDEAVGASLRALEIRGDLPLTFCNALLMANYLDGLEPETLIARHREFDVRFGRRAPWLTHSNEGDAGRRLRVGYVSADLRRHSVAYFVEPVLDGYDRERFEVHCYFNLAKGDEVTQRLRARVHGWVQCERMSDEQLAQRIQQDGIDILVDLAGHTSGNRVLMFARKPAPVQVSYLGYPTTTGLSAMDYRLTDWEVDPPGYEAFNAERPLRLAHSYYCYRPFEHSPPVAALPARDAGHITFGSFNNLAKVSPGVLELWARVLEAVPGSRLLLKAKSLADAGVRASMVERLGRLGVEPERVELRGWEMELGTQLSLYGRMDIGLDTHPYNGGTTTCEALWMGVPVVTLSGRTHASRMGASLLKAAGLPQLVTGSAQDYVRIAVELARDWEELERLRAGMRERLRSSALLDEHRFVRDLEAAYRQMWRNWCQQRAAA